MPINASDFIKLLGIGKKKTTGKGGPAAPAVPMPTIAPDGGRDFRFDHPTLPAAPVAPPTAAPGAMPGMSGQQWLDMALSALGGGPDRSAYVAPFDAAEQRARQANAQAVPAIAANYDRMRGELTQDQGVVDRDAANARAQMAAVQGALQAQLSQNAAPILADLAAQGGTPALGGLMGAAQAQIGTGQAQLAQQAATQQQLSGNMQAATTASHNSRLADSQLAQSAATSSANNTLDQVLAQLDQRKASALQQYAQDSQSYGSKVASARMEAAQRDEARNDPMAQLDLQMKQMDVAERQKELADRLAAAPTGQAKHEWETWHDNLSRSNPVSYDLLYGIMGENDTYAEAIAALNRKIANKETKTKGGNQLDATFLRDRLKEAYDIHDRMMKDEEAAAKKTAKR